MKITPVLFVVAGCALVLSGCVTTNPEASAYPDPSLAPTYGEVILTEGNEAGIVLVAGGEFNAAGVASTCGGMIYGRPDYAFNVSTSGDATLILGAVSLEADTTLVVYGPDRLWYCDDDGGEGLDPLMGIRRAAPGRYVVWVGTYNGGYANAALFAQWSLPAATTATAPVGNPTPRFIN
jgi:hypothetical protein